MVNCFAGLDIFNISIIWCGIILGVMALVAILMLLFKCKVVYYDSEDGREEIHREKYSWLSRAKIHSANKRGKRLVGWSKVPNGSKPLTKHKLVMVRSIKLYAIWTEAPIIEATPVVEPEVIKEPDYSEGVLVKFNYVDTQSGEVVASEGYRLEASVPEKEGVIGWGFAPDGEVLFKNSDENYVFTINLYPVCVLDDDSETVVSTEGFDGESIVELIYNLTSTSEAIYKETHYFKLRLPKGYKADKKFVGWSVVPDGDVVIERGEVDSLFSIPLYSIHEAVAGSAATAS